MWTPLPAYAELHCLSAFSFQRGASLPEELVQRAAALGYSALAITDECSVSGVVRAHTQAQESGIQLLPGAEFLVPPDADAAPQQVPAGRAAESITPAAPVRLVVLPHNLQGWGNLCEFITAARRKAAKGTYEVSWAGSDWASLQHCEVLLAPTRAITFEALCAACLRARQLFDSRLWLALELLHGLDDDLWQHKLESAGAHTGVPLVAASGACSARARACAALACGCRAPAGAWTPT